MKLFFKIFNEWILFVTIFAMLSGFLRNLINTHLVPDYFVVLFFICLICAIISVCVLVIKWLMLFINDDIGDYFK